MEQTITMKSHKANLTKNRKQPKTKKNHQTPRNHLEIYGNQQKTTKLRQKAMGAMNHKKPLKTNKNHETILETNKLPSKKMETNH